MKKTYLLAAAAFGALTVNAKTISVSPGATPKETSEAVRKAVRDAASGDTISFSAGVYQHDGETWEYTAQEATASGTKITSKTWVVPWGKSVHFVGPEGEKWGDRAILRGTGVGRFFYGSAGSTFRNLTFEDFAASDHPELTPTSGGNLNKWVLGGALCCNDFSSSVAVSNCVFRGNTARSGGAVYNMTCADSYFTNNVAKGYYGGAGAYVSLIGCLVAGNSGVNGGAVLWPKGAGLVSSTFLNNWATSGTAGAVAGDADNVISNCVFRGNYAKDHGGALVPRPRTCVTDCTFEDNASDLGGGAVYCGDVSGANGAKGTVFRRCVFKGNSAGYWGGAIHDALAPANRPVVIVDCAFSNNTAKLDGGAVYGGAITNCLFFGNACDVGGTGRRGGAVFRKDDLNNTLVDCTFVSNHFVNIMSDATRGAAVAGQTSNLILRCSFFGNYANVMGCQSSVVAGPATGTRMLQVVDCAFTNNFNCNGGLVFRAACTNTVFFGNEVPSSGGVLRQGRAVDCLFRGNRKWDSFWNLGYKPSYGVIEANNPSGDATESYLYRCDLDCGGIVNCSVVACTIHSLTNLGSHCAFYGPNAVTNTLIHHCDPCDKDNRGLIYRWGYIAPAGNVPASEFVNCTFADNLYGFLVHYPQEDNIPTTFRNCLFSNNRSQYGLKDMAIAVKDNRTSDVTLSTGVAISHCVYGAEPLLMRKSADNHDTWTNLGGNRVIASSDLLFVAERSAELDAPYYMLQQKSPAVGLGDASLFGAAAKDLAGNPRLRGGKVDPGCYESWCAAPGFLIFVR